MGAASVLNFLDDLDVFDTWGIAVEKGHAQFLIPHEPKERFTKSWGDQQGIQIHLAPVFLKEKEVTLRCVTILNDLEEFNDQYYAFVEQLEKPMWHTWMVANHATTYSVFYKGMKNGEKISRNFLIGPVVFEFDLVLLVQPTLMVNATQDITVDLNGTLFKVYPAGTRYINVITAGGGVTPTINLTKVDVADGNTVVVTASASTGYTVQYSLQRQDPLFPIRNFTFQSSNIFQNVSNGRYIVQVRLMEVNSVNASSQEFSINYTAPPPVETITIDTVSINQNNATVLATPANTTKQIEYSNGGTFQSSNVFANLMPGTYTFTARLVGATIADTETASITYVPTVRNFNTVLLTGQTSASITYTGLEGTEFHFNAQPSGTFPMSMLLYLGATPLGKVDFNPESLGQPCAIKYNGQLYLIPPGFQNDTVNV